MSNLSSNPMCPHGRPYGTCLMCYHDLVAEQQSEIERLRGLLREASDEYNHSLDENVPDGREPLHTRIMAALGGLPVETSAQLSEDARDAARYRVVRVSSITGAVLAHQLDAACDVIIATRNAVKASDELPSQAAVIHDNGDAYK